jgi:iron(III) transport system substrate-binding protein
MLIALCAALTVAACGFDGSGGAPEPGKAIASDATLEEIVKEANAEGELNVGWPPGVLDPAELADEFNKTYGTDIKVTYTSYPVVSDLAAQVIQLQQAGKAPPVDVMLAPSDTLRSLAGGEVVEPANWEWADNVTSEEEMAPDGIALVFTNDLLGITYSTEAIGPKDVPTSLEDLLDPKYKGMIASTPYAAGWNYLFADDLWGETPATEYLNSFTKQVSGLIGCNETDRVASGEFPILALDCSIGRIEVAKRNGLPVDTLVPTDAAMVTQWYQVSPKGAEHPAAAKLWMNFMLSRSAQEALYETAGNDSIDVEGSHVRAVLDNLEAKGVQPKLINYEWWDMGAGLEKNLSYGDVAQAILTGD